MSHTVAVYGSLLSGLHNHYLFGDAPVLIDQDTVSGKYDMYPYSPMAHFPYLCKGDSTIQVEVYEVDDTILKRLDALEGYPHFYNREEVVTDKGHKAWVYFLEKIPTPNEEKVPSGDWKEYLPQLIERRV